jgi:hypothetical protein
MGQSLSKCYYEQQYDPVTLKPTYIQAHTYIVDIQKYSDSSKSVPQNILVEYYDMKMKFRAFIGTVVQSET